LEKTRKNKVLAHTVCENSPALAFLLFLSLNKHGHLADAKSKFQRQKVSMAAERGLCFLPAAVSVCQICSKRRRCRYGSKFWVLFFLRSARGEIIRGFQVWAESREDNLGRRFREAAAHQRCSVSTETVKFQWNTYLLPAGESERPQTSMEEKPATDTMVAMD